VKIKSQLFRLLNISLLLASMSCMTTYDVYGRPMQTVDPVVAVAGIAAAGLLGYAVTSNHGHPAYYYDEYSGGAYYRGDYGPCY